MGRKSVIEKFPECIPLLVDLLSSHGANAHARRRDDVARICGVSLRMMREFLIDNVPGLGEKFTLCLDTIHHWFIAPRIGTINGEKYCNYIRAKGYSIQNNDRIMSEEVLCPSLKPPHSLRLTF